MIGFWRFLLCGAFSLALVFGASCKKKDSTPPTPHDQGTLAAATTEAASPWNLVLTISPEHPRMIKPTIFAVHITDADGKPGDGLTVAGHLTMRAMSMGETQVKFEPKGGGNYEASVKEMDMSGPWTLTVDATRDATREQKSFEFVVGE